MKQSPQKLTKLPRAARSRRWGTVFIVSIAVFAMVRFGTAQHPELPETPKAGTFEFALESHGHTRTALVHIPQNYEAESKPPLVLILHGAGGSGEQILSKNGWLKKSDDAGFIAVAPTGLPARPRLKSNVLANPNLWNSGQLRKASPRTKIDDVAYVSSLLDELQKRVPYETKRVFVTGHSNGAGMTFRLGAELSERFAGMAMVSGMLAIENPKPKNPLPSLYIIGTKDPLQPLEGGEVKLPWGKRENVPVSNYLTAWAKAIDCETEAKVVRDNDELKQVEFPSKVGGPTLRVTYVKGHGHSWPATKPGRDGLRRWTGPVKTHFDATDGIWTFFSSIK